MKYVSNDIIGKDICSISYPLILLGHFVRKNKVARLMAMATDSGEQQIGRFTFH